MKKHPYFFLVLAGLAFISIESCSLFKKSASVPPVPPPPLVDTVPMKNAIDSLSYAIGVNVASYFKSQGVDSINFKLLNRAFNDILKDSVPLLDEINANMTLQEKLQSFAAKKLNAQKEADSLFLQENKKRPGVVTTPSGLQYEVVKNGTGTVHPTASDRVKVHYTGKLTNGKKFDSSVDRGQPLEIGVGQVIKGWTEALQLMKKGDKWIIYIPSSIGYGDRGAGADIPGGAALVFEVELLEIL